MIDFETAKQNKDIMKIAVRKGEKVFDSLLRFIMSVRNDTIVGFDYERFIYSADDQEEFFYVATPVSGFPAADNCVYVMPFDIPYVVENGVFVEKHERIANLLGNYQLDIPDKMVNKVKGEVLKAAIRRMDFAVDFSANRKGVEFTRRLYGSFKKKSGKWILQMRLSDERSDKFLKEQLQLFERVKKDSLTQVYNKAAFIEIVTENIDATTLDEHPALMIIDVDHFKQVNDTFGHIEGDSILVTLSEVLSSVPGGIPGRFGGDEFVLYLKNTYYDDEQQLTKVAEGIIDDFKQQTARNYPDFPMSISVGAAVLHRDGDIYEELLHNADKALYYVKGAGRDGFKICTEEIKNDESRQKAIERVNKPIDSESRIGNQLTEMAFDILEDARDIKRAVNALLQRVGVRYDLSLIIAVEQSESGNEHVNYLWHGHDFNISDGIEKIVYDEERLAEFGIASCENVQIKSGSLEVGRICFADTTPNRVWTGEELDAFSAISKIIGSYLNRKRKYRAYEKQFEIKASLDEVTGLLKLEKFKKVVNQILANSERGTRYALIAADIHNFKYFNEYYGFENGDKLLHDFAEIVIKHNPRVIAACRDYADNFLAFVNYSKEGLVKQTIQGYIDNFEAIENGKFGDFKISLSLGVCMAESGTDDVAHLMDNAIAAQRSQKDSGSGGVTMYSQNMNVSRLKEIAIIHMLEDALEREQFEIFLQPKFDLKTRTLCGAEALARWRKPSGIIGMPDEFIPILEKTGRVMALDYMIYEMLLRQIKKWQIEGKPVVPVSTNFSRLHIKNNVFISYLNRQAEQIGVDKKYVEIEITEGAFVENQDALIKILHEIKDSGFKIAIDDFGKGYSSLSMLTEINADYVKIDKDFLRKSGEPPHPMLGDVIKLIHDSNMTIVCEGVESESQANFLAEKGCQIGQGYLFGKPMPVSEFEEKFFK